MKHQNVSVRQPIIILSISMYSKWITIVVCFYSLAFIPIRFSRITFSSKTDAIHYRSSLIDNTIFIDDTPVITDPLFDKTPRITFYNSSESMRERIPVLMDSFAYYENKSLIVEAIFNLKYLTVSKEEKERIAKSHCIAWVGDKTANNTTIRLFSGGGFVFLGLFLLFLAYANVSCR